MDFYQGQTITLINLTGSGTGTDVRGRHFAARFGGYTGTSVTVRNESSREGLQKVFKAHPDGLSLWAMAAGGLMPRGVLGLLGADNRLNELSYVGIIGYPLCYVLWVKPEGRYHSVNDLKRAKGLRFASTRAESVLSQGNALSIEILSLDARVMTDFGEAGEIATAIAKGTADCGVLNFYPGLKFAEKGLIKPLVVVGSKRNKALPGIETITELASLSQDQKGMLAAFEMMPIGTPIFGPPGIPEDRLKFLRQAFIRVMDREDFRRELEKESGVWDEPLKGEEASERVQTLMKDRSIYQKLHRLVQKHVALPNRNYSRDSGDGGMG